MLGLEELKNTFGMLTIGFVIEMVLAVVCIVIVYNKLKKSIIRKHRDEDQRDRDLAEALEGVRNMPKYKQQSIEIQKELKNADAEILKTCEAIKNSVIESQEALNKRLSRSEDRERNALRVKILDMHRLFTSVSKNPMRAWTEMERDAFDEVIKDYESLDGDGHVHTVVIPDMNKLNVILMTDIEALQELFHSRKS